MYYQPDVLGSAKDIIDIKKLIKKFQPKYNVERKDDKSFSYVTISKEIYPRVEIVRETNITSPFGKGELGGFEKLSTRKNPSPTLPFRKGESLDSDYSKLSTFTPSLQLISS